jgi:hypothetical protein
MAGRSRRLLRRLLRGCGTPFGASILKVARVELQWLKCECWNSARAVACSSDQEVVPRQDPRRYAENARPSGTPYHG